MAGLSGKLSRYLGLAVAVLALEKVSEMTTKVSPQQRIVEKQLAFQRFADEFKLLPEPLAVMYGFGPEPSSSLPWKLPSEGFLLEKYEPIPGEQYEQIYKLTVAGEKPWGLFSNVRNDQKVLSSWVAITELAGAELQKWFLRTRLDMEVMRLSHFPLWMQAMVAIYRRGDLSLSLYVTNTPDYFIGNEDGRLQMGTNVVYCPDIVLASRLFASWLSTNEFPLQRNDDPNAKEKAPEPAKPALEVHLMENAITYNGSKFANLPVGACELFSLLLEHHPKQVSVSEFLPEVRVQRIKNTLPKELGELIDSGRGKPTCLKLS